MRQIQIIAVGKLRDARLRDVCDEYLQRCRHSFAIKETEVRDLRAIEAELPSRGLLVVLDERGEELQSRAFAAKLKQWLGSGTASVTFVVGGADGLSEAIRQRATLVLSLGRMTFAHRLVRVMLAEQIYRAISILEGSPYHRD